MTERLGFGVHKLDPKPGATREERVSRSRHMLARVLNLNTTIAFVGSGCSVPLNYPTWKKLTSEVVKHTYREIRDTRSVHGETERLERFLKRLRSRREIKSDQLLFMLGVCQQIFEQKGGEHGKSLYRQFVAGLFEKPLKAAQGDNPYHALMKLPISRFVTSNYDFEIEKALAAIKGVAENELKLDGTACPPDKLRTFTQQPQNFNHLALFVLSRVKEADNMVFHCHGSYQEPDSMVITEADYQSWYFGERDDAGIAFRQTLNLLFGSNPILFVGFGLTDDDLMRPLRMFAAEDLKKRSLRPLFALMPQSPLKEKQKANEDYFDQLFDRYGVHVIPYELDPTDPSKTLFHALTELDDFRRQCRIDWLEKPLIRQVELTAEPPDPYQHYPLVRDKADDFKGPRIMELLDKLYEDVEARARVIGLIGLGGTGKSWFAQELLHSLYQKQARAIDESQEFKGFFFWSSYYSNDALTGLDRALAYLDPKKRHEGDRIERFRKCLRSDRYLLVFDGIERFLRETDKPIEGKGFTVLADNLLGAMRDGLSQSTVVITSRLWPKVFGPFQAKWGPIRSYLIQRYRSEDIIDFEPFSWLMDQKAKVPANVSALVSLLDGHAHALVLAAEMLRTAGKEGAPEKLIEINRSLSATPPDRRAERMIRMAIKSLNDQSNGLASKLLERLSVFMVPVADSTVKICFEEASKERQNSGPDQCALIKELIRSRLIHEATAKRGGIEYSAYTVHPIVREYIFHQIHGAPIGSLPNFSLPGFTAATSAFDPGNKETVKMMEDLFYRLCEQAENRNAENRGSEARGLCRSAFSLIRSRMEALTAPRWGSYDDYLKLLITLSHLARKVSEGTWNYQERRSIDEVEKHEGPLYADELAWLYNELGLACYGEGAMPDTLAIWEQGLEINRVIDSHEEGGNYLFQSQCNLGAAHIHYGHLDTAEKYLQDAERTNFRLKYPRIRPA